MLQHKENSMDMNVKTFINTTEENRLLNAIKNKFDGQAASEGFSLPKFNIPLLKIPGSSALDMDQKDLNTKVIQLNNPSTQLNQFLLKQLQEKHACSDSSEKPTGFVLPKLKTSCDKTTVKFDMPVLNSIEPSTPIGSLTTAIKRLKVQENVCDDVKSVVIIPATIDLTTALTNKYETHQGIPPTRDLIKSQPHDADLNFEIPFIDCDRVNTSKRCAFLLPASNEYCVTDISHVLLKHSLAKPSVIGHFLSMSDDKYMDPLPVKYLTPKIREQKVKHTIEPFNFDTKSPDDIVLLALSKNQRRRYN